MTQDSEEDVEEVLIYAVYQWDCSCGSVNEVGHDATGEVLECQDCRGKSRVKESR